MDMMKCVAQRSKRKYIDADELIKTLNREGVPFNEDVNHFILHAPAADVAEVKRGRWETEVRTIYGHKIPFFVCSVCGKSAADEYNYCPWCGAKMDEVEDETKL